MTIFCYECQCCIERCTLILIWLLALTYRSPPILFFLPNLAFSTNLIFVDLIVEDLCPLCSQGIYYAINYFAPSPLFITQLPLNTSNDQKYFIPNLDYQLFHDTRHYLSLTRSLTFDMIDWTIFPLELNKSIWLASKLRSPLQYIWVQEWRALLNTLPIVIVTCPIHLSGFVLKLDILTID